ncbi:MAG: efflux RND transporter periplasmic adaptor subunit [Campylobacter sp.]|nr:efflux RND transporter periplasmic adaptor subunit [Campylobacter sp.]
MRKILILLFGILSLNAEQIYANYDAIAVQSSKLVFQNSGLINSLKVDVSSQVKKGDILATLESSDLQISLKNAQAEYDKALAFSEFSASTYSKFKKVKDVTSAQRYDEAKFNYEKAQAELKKARAGVNAIKNSLEKMQLKAPFDGVISAKYTEIGNGVMALNTPIFEIISTPKVKILIQIDEKYANKVKIGDEYKFNVGDMQKTAKISLIYPTINIQTRKFKAEAISEGVKVGSFGEGYIEIK